MEELNKPIMAKLVGNIFHIIK